MTKRILQFLQPLRTPISICLMISKALNKEKKTAKIPPTTDLTTEKTIDKTGIRQKAKKITAKILIEEEDIVN